MRQFSAAVISRVLDPFKSLLTSPSGRHSATAGRRRRSSRVRRYAPAPPPLPEAPPQTSRALAPRLSPPAEPIHADEVALVRPYFAAHERLRAARTRIPAPRPPEPDEVQRAFARVQERAAAILLTWQDNPEGDALSGPAPRFGTLRATSSTSAASGEWDELAALTRTWLHQQHQGVSA
ncbi:hypothetical protein [Nocardiopsis sp. FR26]|uniref:hypothetical protein n=1 Tax=Nocardiopsis sp. FR26 TaxID=2605987 RepID=UPI00135A74FD|nr:hypothetical protein [Nocardiopsis sp. FR26]